jgi:hypothetical protein
MELLGGIRPVIPISAILCIFGAGTGSSGTPVPLQELTAPHDARDLHQPGALQQGEEPAPERGQHAAGPPQLGGDGGRRPVDGKHLRRCRVLRCAGAVQCKSGQCTAVRRSSAADEETLS